MIKLKNILAEEVYGNKATVYHRTRSHQLLTSLILDGFQHSSGMYGKGIYTTYEPTEKTNWTPSPDPNAKDEDIHPEGRYNYDTYGMFQVKFMVDLINFFIFDWDVYQKVTNHVAKVEKFTKKKSDKNNFINLQAEYFKMPHRINTAYRKRYTSEIALKFGFEEDYTYLDNPLVNGIVFFGSRDGNVLVCYNKSMIVPISMSHNNFDKPLNLQKILDSNMKLKDEFKSYFKKFINSKNKAMSNVMPNVFEIAKEMWDYDETTNMFSHKGDVKITDEFIKDGKLLIKFDIVKGDFNCGNTSLTTLEGVPKHVSRDFDCSNTNIESLDYSPTYVGRDFMCCECNSLMTIQGCPSKIKRNFLCINCSMLETLHGGPEYVGNDFDCRECTSLTSLDGAPKYVDRDFDCIGCRSLTSIEGISRASSYHIPNEFIHELGQILDERGEN